MKKKKQVRKRNEKVVLIIVTAIIVFFITINLSVFFLKDSTKIISFEVIQNSRNTSTAELVWRNNFDLVTQPTYEFEMIDNGCLGVVATNYTTSLKKWEKTHDYFVFTNHNCSVNPKIRVGVDTGKTVAYANLELQLLDEDAWLCKERGFVFVSYNVELNMNQCCVRMLNGYYCELIE